MQGANTYVSLLLLGSHSHPLLSMSKLQSLSGSISPGNNPPVFWPGGLTDFYLSELNTIIKKENKQTKKNFANLVEKKQNNKQKTALFQPAFVNLQVRVKIFPILYLHFRFLLLVSFVLFPYWGIHFFFSPFKAKSSLYMLEM